MKTPRLQQPCSMRWQDLEGSDAARFCHKCQKLVHNLDLLSTAETEALIAAHPTGFCGTQIRPPRAGVATAAILATALTGCSDPAATEAPPLSEEPMATEEVKELTAKEIEMLRQLGGYV